MGLFLLVFIDNFGVYSDRASHLAKFELVFQRLDGLAMALSPKKITIGFLEGKMEASKGFKASLPHHKKGLSRGDGGLLLKVHTLFVVKARLLTQFLQKGALAPMEDEVLKHVFKQLKSTL